MFSLLNKLNNKDDKYHPRASQHPHALRISEIEQAIERGFWASGGGHISGAFAVVAQILAEHEDRIRAMEQKQDA